MNEMTEEKEPLDDDEWLSVDLLSEINNVIEKIQGQDAYHDIESVAQDAMINTAVDDFLSLKNLTAKQELEVRRLIMQKIQAEKEKDLHGTHIKQKPRFTMAEMKKIIEPNIASAADNYIKFVKPFEAAVLGDKFDAEKFQKELKTFKERQATYIIEDLGGNMTLHDLNLAVDALMEALPDVVRRREDEIKKRQIGDVQKQEQQGIGHAKEKEDLRAKQKAAVAKRVLSVATALQKIDENDIVAINAYWDGVAQDIAQKDGLVGEVLDDTMRKFRLYWKELFAAGQKRGRERMEKERRAKMSPDQAGHTADIQNEIPAADEKRKQNDPREMSEELTALERKLQETRQVYVQKKFAHESAWSRMVAYFGDKVSGQHKSDTTDLALYQSEYQNAKMAYRDALFASHAENDGEDSDHTQEQGVAFEIMEKCDLYDVQEVLRAETMGGKISHIVKNVATYMKRVAPAARSIFVATLLAGGLIGGWQMVAQDQANVGKSNVESILRAKQKLVADARTVFDEKVIAAQARDRVAQENEAKMVPDFIQDHTVKQKDLVTVHEGSSINRSVRAYLKTHFSQLVASGHFFTDIEESAKFRANLSQQNQKYYDELLQGVSHPKMLDKLVEWKATRLIDDYEKAHVQHDALDHVQPQTNVVMTTDERGVHIASVTSATFDVQNDHENTVGSDEESRVIAHVTNMPDQIDIGQKMGHIQKNDLDDKREQYAHADNMSDVDIQKSVVRNELSALTEKKINSVSAEEEMRRIREILDDPQESHKIRQQVFDYIADLFGDEKLLHEKNQKARHIFAQKIARMNIGAVRDLMHDPHQKKRIDTILAHMSDIKGVSDTTKLANYLFRMIVRERILQEQSK